MATKDTPHLRLRIEPKLLARLEKSRQKTGRTLTGEIVERLEHSFRKDDMKDLMEQMAQSFREHVLADLVSPDVPLWVAELSRAEEMEAQAARTKNKEEKDKLFSEASAIRASVEKARFDDQENAAKRWRNRLTARRGMTR
jgi:hypothetical protein